MSQVHMDLEFIQKANENKCIMVLIWLELGKKRLELQQMVTSLFQEEMVQFLKTIKIVHKHGVTTLYGHLHKLSVKMQVKEGQVHW